MIAMQACSRRNREPASQCCCGCSFRQYLRLCAVAALCRELTVRVRPFHFQALRWRSTDELAGEGGPLHSVLFVLSKEARTKVVRGESDRIARRRGYIPSPEAFLSTFHLLRFGCRIPTERDTVHWPEVLRTGMLHTTDLLSVHKEQFISHFLAYCRNVNGSTRSTGSTLRLPTSKLARGCTKR
jgi:hypothetical protein